MGNVKGVLEMLISGGCSSVVGCVGVTMNIGSLLLVLQRMVLFWCSKRYCWC